MNQTASIHTNGTAYCALEAKQLSLIRFDKIPVTHRISGTVLQQDAYYPYGMNIAGLSTANSSPENKYKYNGKRCTERSRSELQDEFGLDWYDYGARFYDAVLGRWHVIDNLSEGNHNTSPYLYVNNNPIFYIDPDGNDEWSFSFSLSMGSGSIGFSGKIPFTQTPYSLNYDFDGSLKNTLTISFSYDTETGNFNVCPEFNRVTTEGHFDNYSLSLGPYTFESSKTNVSPIISSNTENKAKEDDDPKPTVSVGAGRAEVSASSDGFGFGISQSVNALMVGVGAELQIKYTPSSNKVNNNNSDLDNNKSKSITPTLSPIKEAMLLHFRNGELY